MVDDESKDKTGARETADLTEVVCPAAPFRIEKNFRLTGKWSMMEDDGRGEDGSRSA